MLVSDSKPAFQTLKVDWTSLLSLVAPVVLHERSFGVKNNLITANPHQQEQC